MKEFIKKHKRIKKIARALIDLIKLPALLLAGVVMNRRKIRLNPKSEESDSIGVLGRGISLVQAGQLNFLDDFVIANATSKELKTEPIRSLLKGKRIIHMVNIGEGVLPAWYLLKYNIYKYVVARFKPDGSKTRLRSPRKVYATERFGFKTDLLPEEMASYLKESDTGCGAGVVALVYAAIALKKKNVYVAGMDFYEANYLIDLLNPEEFDILRGTCNTMMEYITNFMAKCPDTNFHFITASSFKCSLSNVKVYNYNIK